MKHRLKPLRDQVIVITGASSGIGLATALEAVKRGAKVVLTSRNGEDLKKIAEKIQSEGGQADYVVADVANDSDVQRAAEHVTKKFGGFDTWVNNAGASVYGRLVDVPLDEKRRVFDTNFWGVVHGCKAAVKHMRKNGGAIINIGSEASVHSLPLQGIYAASKHAIKAYTDALRMELEEENVPISVTLIKPGAINTPFTSHAKNHMERDPELPSPIYSPEVVARAILACAQKPTPSLYVGGSAFLFGTLELLFPRLMEKLSERMFFEGQKATTRKRRDEGLQKTPEREGEVYGDSPHRMRRTSLYTSAMLHPIVTVALAVGMSTVAVSQFRRFQENKNSDELLAA
jgi:short-subunit dehydrogenase